MTNKKNHRLVVFFTALGRPRLSDLIRPHLQGHDHVPRSASTTHRYQLLLQQQLLAVC